MLKEIDIVLVIIGKNGTIILITIFVIKTINTLLSFILYILLLVNELLRQLILVCKQTKAYSSHYDFAGP